MPEATNANNAEPHPRIYASSNNPSHGAAEAQSKGPTSSENDASKELKPVLMNDYLPDIPPRTELRQIIPIDSSPISITIDMPPNSSGQYESRKPAPASADINASKVATPELREAKQEMLLEEYVPSRHLASSSCSLSLDGMTTAWSMAWLPESSNAARRRTNLLPPLIAYVKRKPDLRNCVSHYSKSACARITPRHPSPPSAAHLTTTKTRITKMTSHLTNRRNTPYDELLMGDEDNDIDPFLR